MPDENSPLSEFGITVLSQQEQTVPDENGGYVQAIVVRFKGDGWGPVTVAIPSAVYTAAAARAAVLAKAAQLAQL